MTKISCDKCGKIFKLKSDLQRHLNRKFPCKSGILESIDENIGEFKCPTCPTTFTHKGSLYRHLMNGCPTIKNYSTLVEEVKSMKDIISKLQIGDIDRKPNSKVSCDNNTNSNNVVTSNIQNIHNDIKIIALGAEDLDSMITDDQAIKYLKMGYQSVYNLINDIHFDPNHPERHNAYITNLGSEYAIKYTKNGWEQVTKDDLIEQMFSDKQCYLADAYKEFGEKLDEKSRAKFWQSYREKDPDVLTGLKNEIKLLLFNKRDIPISTRKTMEKNKQKKIK